MPPPNLKLFTGPIGPLRDKKVMAVGAADIEFPNGAIIQVAAAGNIKYRTLEGSEDLVENGLAAGATINACGVPVLVSVVRGSDDTTTVNSIVVGIV